MGGRIRVLIVDDHRLFREGLRMILRQQEGIDLVGEMATGLEAIHLINDLKPDVVLLDITMPELNGIEAIPSITQSCPDTKALMLTASMDEATVFKAMKAGAKGYISKSAGISELVKAIQAVHQGELWVERKLVSRFLDEAALANSPGEDRDGGTKEGLTLREMEVLRCLAEGNTNKEIAQALSIREKTVKSHLNSIFRKLKVTRRLQAIIYAFKEGLD